MSEVTMLCGNEVEETLRTAAEKNFPAILSYLTNDKWFVAKVQVVGLAGDKLAVQRSETGEKPRPINIQVNQPVGVSFKYQEGKLVFDTTVFSLEPTSDQNCRLGSGNIILARPDHCNLFQRRSYFRVNVPESLNVKVTLWHRQGSGAGDRGSDDIQATSNEQRNYFQGKLVDISAGGAQIMVPYQDADDPENRIQKTENRIQNSDSHLFKKGQFIGMRFTPMPYEVPLVLSAQIRHILPSEDKTRIYLGVQIVGLEASFEGHQILIRLAEVVQRYHQLNLSGVKEPEMPNRTFAKEKTIRKKPLPLLCL